MSVTQPSETHTIDRAELAKMVTTLFAHWQLSTEEQLALLGLSIANRAALARYRKGLPLAQSRDLLDRVGILLGIHKSLRLLFPHNRELAYAWMTQHNKAFEGMTPAETIKQWGFNGLFMVRAYLDRARGQ
ncbi:MAG: MbcA/ParS/Xre antitoxin family protein [Gammaproteobacteria bacterium]|nr:MbcA/ParS/Xre antitoxin family protein [Gammaproteobacteria bacterium]MCF6260407.1 MbcA/ParS/Xre antitoxin family protein [Gammaproteobacteria bacterium]